LATILDLGGQEILMNHHILGMMIILHNEIFLLPVADNYNSKAVLATLLGKKNSKYFFSVSQVSISINFLVKILS